LPGNFLAKAIGGEVMGAIPWLFLVEKKSAKYAGLNKYTVDSGEVDLQSISTRVIPCILLEQICRTVGFFAV